MPKNLFFKKHFNRHENLYLKNLFQAVEFCMKLFFQSFGEEGFYGAISS